MSDLLDQRVVYDLSNDEYHRHPAISNSGLSDIAKSPAVYQWRKSAPVDHKKTKALDFGTACHSWLLENYNFDDEYVIEPKFNKRTNAGKEEAIAFEKANAGRTIISNDDYHKIKLMCDSALCHPDANDLLTASGKSEVSIFWRDDITGELCRCRPDRILDSSPVIVDLKTTDDIDRFDRSIAAYRYHVQAAFYSTGYYELFGAMPRFVFVVIGKKIDCGRYPIRVFELDDESVEKGAGVMRRDLDLYHKSKSEGLWRGVEKISLPRWALEEVEIF